MTTTATSKCSTAGTTRGLTPRRPLTSVPFVARLVVLLSIWVDRARERRQLYALDDHMLKDIGLTRADVELEIHKHFWRS